MEREFHAPVLRNQRAGSLKKVRILLADDHPHFPEFVESLLETSFEIVGKVGDGQALLKAAANLQPDVIVTDISMPLLNGIEAAEQLRGTGCNARIIFLTVHSDPDFVRSCLATGASGYITKPRVALDLIPAIREALAGHLFISPHETQENHV
ncbi:MAG TPA: response regulator transcription factor [Candidatus Acidoferrum sp.]|nr:response regulator transcription factor [Candidatus Acidoferrum sp.]